MGRARSGVDTGRLAAAASRPGIDPRVWLTLAIVEDIGFDAEEGIFVDVQFQPDGTKETAYLGLPYAGAEFGLYCPVEIGDTVLVAVPGGDPGNGPIIISRWNNSGDKPSADFQSTADAETASPDMVLRVKPGQKFKVRTSGSSDGVDITVEGDGNVLIQATGSGKVYLGGSDGTEPIALGTTLKNYLSELKNWADNHTHVYTDDTLGPQLTTPPASAPPAVLNPSPSIPDIEADEVAVK